MAYNNIDEAVTIPVSPVLHGYIGQLKASSERNKLINQQLAKDAQTKQDALAKMVGSAFSDKAHLTGTAYDPVVIRQIADAKVKYAQQIRKGEITNPAELQMQIQNDMGNIGAMAAGIKGASANIDAQVKMLAKNPGMDANAIAQLAKTLYMYDVDPKTGQRTLKDPSKLDNNTDYVAKAMNDYPELISNGDVGIKNFVKKFNSPAIGAQYKDEQGGVTVDRGFKGKLPGYMEEIKDKTGFTKGIRVRTQPVPGLKNSDGTPFEVAADDVYEAAKSDPDMSAYLQKRYKQANTATNFEEGSKESEILKRKILLDDLQKYNNGEFIPNRAVTKINALDMKEAGISRFKEGMSFAEKQAKEQMKFEGLDPAVILRAAGGDESVLKGAIVVETENGKHAYDITNMIGGMNIGMDKDGKAIHAKGVYVDPADNSLIIKDSSGKFKTYKGADMQKKLLNISGYNSLNVDKATKSMKPYLDDAGNYIGKKNLSSADALIEKDALKQAEAFKNKKSAVQEGSQKALREAYNGKTLNDGSTIKTVTVFSVLGMLPGVKPYAIEIQNPDGTTSTKGFKTKEQMATFLKENVDNSK